MSWPRCMGSADAYHSPLGIKALASKFVHPKSSATPRREETKPITVRLAWEPQSSLDQSSTSANGEGTPCLKQLRMRGTRCSAAWDTGRSRGGVSDQAFNQCHVSFVTPTAALFIDRHPGAVRAWIVSACSGHGFSIARRADEALQEGSAWRTSPRNLDNSTQASVARTLPVTNREQRLGCPSDLANVGRG